MVLGMPGEAEGNRPSADAGKVPDAAPGTRIYFADNLKILLAILVVLHYAAQPYGRWPQNRI